MRQYMAYKNLYLFDLLFCIQYNGHGRVMLYVKSLYILILVYLMPHPPENRLPSNFSLHSVARKNLKQFPKKLHRHHYITWDTIAESFQTFFLILQETKRVCSQFFIGDLVVLALTGRKILVFTKDDFFLT